MFPVLPVSEILSRHISEYSEQKKRLLAELKKLPARGTVTRKKIKGRIYFYLAYRVSPRKVRSDYLGKEVPAELIKQIESRRDIVKKLRLIRDALYALGAIRRVGSVGISRRFQVLSRDKFTCQYCGRNVRLHKVSLVVDHILAKKRGGSDNSSNLITACVECNAGKHKHLLDGATVE